MTEKKYKAVLCDMDGTIVNSEEIAHRAMREVFERHGGTFTVKLHGKQIGKRMREWLPETIGEMGLTLTSGQFISEFHTLYEGFLDTDLVVNDGFYELVELVKGNGLKFVLVTSSRKATAEKVFKTVGLGDVFDEWVTSESVEKGKPDPEPYKKGVLLAKVEASDCIVFEDSDKGVLSAASAGTDVLAIPTRFAKHLDFSRAVKVCDSLMDAKNYFQQTMGL